MFFFAVFLACYFLGRWSESCKLLIQPKCSQQVHILLQFVLYWLRWRMLQFELVGLNVRSVFSVTRGFKCDSCSTKSVTLYSRFVWSELNWIFTIAYSVWTSTRFIQNLSITANLRRTRDNVIEKKKSRQRYDSDVWSSGLTEILGLGSLISPRTFVLVLSERRWCAGWNLSRWGNDVDRGLRTFLLQKVTPIIASWFAGRTWKNNGKWYT